ncbi:MAG: trypsin-like peptidase domain-containing protein [Anaerolineae bacterium]|jgi:2-alkenal reductase
MQRYKSVIVAIVLLVIANLACSLSAADRNEKQARVSDGEKAPLPTPVSLPTLLPDRIIIEADAEEQLLINIYERANPAVVSINVAADHFDGELIEFGSGSGFVVDKEGHIVTNSHVVQDAAETRITFADGTVATARLVASDQDSDLAVLKVDDVDPERLFPLEFGDSSSLRVGQRVIAIGNPWELGGTMTVGIVSALGRSLQSRFTLDGGFYSIPDIIQTDAAINPGNSGGPLLDSHGRVVGVNTAIRSEDRGNSGVGFAVPVDIVKRVVPALISERRFRYPYLGIYSPSFFTVAELAEVLDLPVQRGVLITDIAPGGPASEAGLQGGSEEIEVWGQPVNVGGDIILAIDGYELRDFADMIAYLVKETSVGQEITLTILRDGEILQTPLTLGERP